MANYCKVVDNKITDGPVSEKYITLLDSSWYPVEYPTEFVFDIATQKRLPDTLEIVGEKVVVTFNIVNKTQEELDEYAALVNEPQPITDSEKLALLETFLKDKFSEDILFPDELKG